MFTLPRKRVTFTEASHLLPLLPTFGFSSPTWNLDKVGILSGDLETLSLVARTIQGLRYTQVQFQSLPHPHPHLCLRPTAPVRLFGQQDRYRHFLYSARSSSSFRNRIMAQKTTLQEFESVFPKLEAALLDHAKTYKLPQEQLDWYKKVIIVP
jgi:hypothetical protein